MVRIRELANKPLIEAIYELRWFVDPEKGDPNYSIFIGRLYDKLIKRYQFHETLPANMIPESMAISIPQHRFRIEKDAWPLVQIGPGLVTLNATDNYTWKDFNERVTELMQAVYSGYPKPEELKVTNLKLRYIDGIKIEEIPYNVFQFIKEKLKIDLSVPNNLYEDANVDKKVHSFSFNLMHDSIKPKGKATLQLSLGKDKWKNTVIMNITVQSTGEDLPELPSGFENWIKDAHEITDNWFFKLIEGDLESEYAGNT